MSFAGKHPTRWTVDDVCSFLVALDLGQLQQTFRAHEVTGHVLLSLTEEDMEVKLGVTKFGWRRTLSLSVMPLMRQNHDQLQQIPSQQPQQPQQSQQPRMLVRSAGTPRDMQSALWRAQSVPSLGTTMRQRPVTSAATQQNSSGMTSMNQSMATGTGISLSQVRSSSPGIGQAKLTGASSPRRIGSQQARYRTPSATPGTTRPMSGVTSSATNVREVTQRRYMTPTSSARVQSGRAASPTPSAVSVSARAAPMVQSAVQSRAVSPTPFSVPVVSMVTPSGYAASVTGVAPVMTANSMQYAVEPRAEPFPEPPRHGVGYGGNDVDSGASRTVPEVQPRPAVYSEEEDMRSLVAVSPPDPVQRLIIVRHGERMDCADPAAWFTSAEATVYPFDCPLTAEGQNEARRVAAEIVGGQLQLALVISSPYVRCVETAVHIAAASGCPLVLDAELGEVFGEHTMGPVSEPPRHRSVDELAQYVPKGVQHVLPSGGPGASSGCFGKWPQWPESLEEGRMRMLKRVEVYAAHSRQWNRSIALITHGDGVAAVLARMLRSRPGAVPGEVVRRVGYCAWLQAERDLPSDPSMDPGHWRLTRTANVEIGVVQKDEGVVVSGPHEALNGRYVAQKGQQYEGRSVYFRATGPQARLFYHGGGGWMVSDQVGADCGWACCMDVAENPTQAKGPWCIWNGNTWVESQGLVVSTLEAQDPNALGAGSEDQDLAPAPHAMPPEVTLVVGKDVQELKKSIRCEAEIGYDALAAAAEAHGRIANTA